MGRKGKAPPEPPGEWLRQSASRLEAARDVLDNDGERRFFTPEDLDSYQRYHAGGSSGSSGYGGGSRLSLPPPWVGSERQYARTRRQWQAWNEEPEVPPGGLRPGGQPTTPAEELHRLVTARVTHLGFCPSNRAVMVCGRPVIVPQTRAKQESKELMWRC